jgi:hypothetical protein
LEEVSEKPMGVALDLELVQGNINTCSRRQLTTLDKLLEKRMAVMMVGKKVERMASLMVVLTVARKASLKEN